MPLLQQNLQLSKRIYKFPAVRRLRKTFNNLYTSTVVQSACPRPFFSLEKESVNPKKFRKSAVNVVAGILFSMKFFSLSPLEIFKVKVIVVIQLVVSLGCH